MFILFASNPFLTTILISSLAGIIVSIWLAIFVLSREKNDKMEEVGQAILIGANAYLKRQFKTIAQLLLF